MHVSLFEGTLVKNVTNQIVFICNKGLFLSSGMHNILSKLISSINSELHLTYWLSKLSRARVQRPQPHSFSV